MWRNLCGVAVVGFDDTSKLLFASNGAMGMRSKSSVQDLVVFPNTSVGPSRIVVGTPGSYDMVQLGKVNAHEVIQALSLERFDPGLREGIGHRGSERCQNAAHTFRLPEFSERLGKFFITVMDEES